jgi:hypothetical protein
VAKLRHIISPDAHRFWHHGEKENKMERKKEKNNFSHTSDFVENL